jgi:hypothetical protein
MDWNGMAAAAREGFRQAANSWISKAQIQGGQINGPSLQIPPGSLKSLTSMEAELLQALTMAKVSPAVANALASTLAGAWNAWAAGFQMHAPGAYPTFAAVPGPVAPPTPSTPIALRQGFSSGEPMLQAALLSPKLSAALRPFAREIGGAAEPAIRALAEWVESSFKEWKNTVMLVGILGRGPVPTFAPPYVPVGPVVMGDSISGGGPIFAGPRFGKIVR